MKLRLAVIASLPALVLSLASACGPDPTTDATKPDLGLPPAQGMGGMQQGTGGTFDPGDGGLGAGGYAASGAARLRLVVISRRTAASARHAEQPSRCRSTTTAIA